MSLISSISFWFYGITSSFSSVISLVLFFPLDFVISVVCFWFELFLYLLRENHRSSVVLLYISISLYHKRLNCLKLKPNTNTPRRPIILLIIRHIWNSKITSDGIIVSTFHYPKKTTFPPIGTCKIYHNYRKCRKHNIIQLI